MITWVQFFWALLAQAAVVATLVGAGIAIAAYFNGKHIKNGVNEIAKMIKEIQTVAEKRHIETMEFLKTQHIETIEFLKIIQQQTTSK